jgi:hypothetical protein
LLKLHEIPSFSLRSKLSFLNDPTPPSSAQKFWVEPLFRQLLSTWDVLLAVSIDNLIPFHSLPFFTPTSSLLLLTRDIYSYQYLRIILSFYFIMCHHYNQCH